MDIIVTIQWCKERGVKLVAPNKEIGYKYISAAIETIQSLQKIQSRVWKATMTYYCEYFLLSAILRTMGIQSTIHECSLEIAGWLAEEKIVSESFVHNMIENKEYRIKNQYFLENVLVKTTVEQLQKETAKTKFLLQTMNKEKIRVLRKKFASL